MTITLTREEAQQVLEHLDDLADFRQWDIDMHVTQYGEEYKPHRVKHMREQLANTNSTIETLRARLSAPEPEYRDVVIKGDLWRIEFLPDHAASVVLVRANYEAQPEPPCKTGSQCIGGKCPQCVVSEPVAWMNEGDIGKTDWKVWAHGKPTATIPLYTAPPQREEGCAECSKKSSDGWALYCVKCSEREWQGLTDKEMMDLELSAHDLNSVSIIALRRFGRAVEAKLRKKNT